MAIKIITIPFDDKAINYFIENKIVKSIKTDIVNYGKPYLNFIIDYEPDKKKQEPKISTLSEKENEVLLKLKDWRFLKSKFKKKY